MNAMYDIRYLYETIKDLIEYGDKPSVPSYITDNLKHTLFAWQDEALQHFLTFPKIKEKKNPHAPTHLMFHMATGAGKTLMMAATILYYYKQGYRHFMFFVNQNNIVDKTENNFIDSTHTKYLYSDKIFIDNKAVSIEKVETFSDEPQGIEIKFTTIHKLYNDIHIQRENQTTLDDLHGKDIVMLADEAHHLNTDTKRNKGVQLELFDRELTQKTSSSEIERKGWEHTVIDLILHKNGKVKVNKNVLLEFTATMPTIESVAKKYQDKIIYRFGLKQFLQAGYTKEINLISSTLPKKERVLQALLFQWYRHKIALKYGIPNFKPVVLFRSKTIQASQEDYEAFLNWTYDISAKDFAFLKTIRHSIARDKDVYEQGRSRTEQLLDFIKNEDIPLSAIADWIRTAFAPKNVIITNSKTNKTKTEKTDEETERLLNSLEDTNNHIRAIFTVDRLTEGWDVLNLFDIVRLYQGQNTGGSTKKTPEATIKEKQLIGRGVRYCPFAYQDKPTNKRKFENDLKHELRILEELYYYTYDEEARYISHLKNELRKDGYIQDGKVVKQFALKEAFIKTPFYQKGRIWYNERIPKKKDKQRTLGEVKKRFFVVYKTKGLELQEQALHLNSEEDLERLNIAHKSIRTLSIPCKNLERHIFMKAINIKAAQENSIFRFENLSRLIPIKSMDDLQKDCLADWELKIVVNRDTSYDDLEPREKLQACLLFLNRLEQALCEKGAQTTGSAFKLKPLKEVFNIPKEKTIEEDGRSKNMAAQLSRESWYVVDAFHGTSEEMALVTFVQETIGDLEKKYDEVYLLRNEEQYTIYDFEQGRGFQPDFLLFLKGKDAQNVSYQVFVEAKGNEYLGYDLTFKTGKEGWKERFLENITAQHGQGIIKFENSAYKLIGLPFFNKDHGTAFRKAYKDLL